MNRRTKTGFQMIADYEGDLSAMLNPNIDTEIPILATRNLVLFPGIIMPILAILKNLI